jgi:hypothetical protein
VAAVTGLAFSKAISTGEAKRSERVAMREGMHRFGHISHCQPAPFFSKG